MLATTQFKPIEKEALSALKFPDEDVLQDPAEKKNRETELGRALALGNLEHSKCKIFFEDTVNMYVVETTVWGVTDKRVILKQGTVIPIKRIYKVSL